MAEAVPKAAVKAVDRVAVEAAEGAGPEVVAAASKTTVRVAGGGGAETAGHGAVTVPISSQSKTAIFRPSPAKVCSNFTRTDTASCEVPIITTPANVPIRSFPAR